MRRHRSSLLICGLVALGLVLLPGRTSAQITAQVGGGVGFVIPSGDYSGTSAEYYNGLKYGLSTGFNLHGKARVGLLGFIVKGEVGYSRLSNTGDVPGGGSLELSHSIITLAAGPEFHFALPALPVTPYLGADVQVNIFSGETVFKGVSGVPTGTLALESATRIGVALNGGAILSVGPGMKLDLGASYAMMNLFGKAWSDPKPTSDNQEDSYGGLNDEKDPFIAVGGSKHFIGSARSVDALRFTATLMIGI